uniref:zinc finger C2HC domain-containing protein 1C n=1 Tax=Monopterus albus TaxID=43700 RepID=UPI0009B31A12|nr:zinc finger C2HC domain-containing protein 1C [Monopterus albus]
MEHLHWSAAGEDRSFPSKPVSHRRPLNPRTQDSHDVYEFEKMVISARDPLSAEEHHSNGIKQITGSRDPRKDLQGLSSGEMQMAEAIHAKQLMLQEKLWRLEEKLRQKIQRDSADAAASEEERHRWGQAERGRAQMKTRLSEQQRTDLVKSREMLMEDRRKEDIKQQKKKQGAEIDVSIWEEAGVMPLDVTVSSPSHSTRPQQGELGLMDSTDISFQLLPCRTCGRKFASERLEKHVQICKKVKNSHRQVFNSYANRTKGSAMEEFWKTHTRSKTPEVLQKQNKRQNGKANTNNLHQDQLPAGHVTVKRVQSLPKGPKHF